MLKKLALASVFALPFTSPTMATCPGNAADNPPLCETGHFAFVAANIVNGCFKVQNTDTGDFYGIQLGPDPDNGIVAGVEGQLTGFKSVVSDGTKVSCDDGKFYKILAVRAGEPMNSKR